MTHMIKTGICLSHLHQPCLIFQQRSKHPTFGLREWVCSSGETLLQSEVNRQVIYNNRKLKIITHQRQMQHHVAIQWDWIGWISGLSYRAPTVLIIWNWYLVYFLKWYFEAGKAGEEKACQGCRPDVKGLQLAVDGKQFWDQTPDQMKIIS